MAPDASPPVTPGSLANALVTLICQEQGFVGMEKGAVSHLSQLRTEQKCPGRGMGTGP